MGLKSAVCIALISICSFLRPCLASETKLEIGLWPAPLPCESCIKLQFGILEMQLPSTLIEKVFVLGNGPASLHLIPVEASDLVQGVVLLEADSQVYIGIYEALGLELVPSMSAREFFDLIGQPTRAIDPLAKVRLIEGIDKAQRYIKSSNGLLHVYWIQGPPGQYQEIRFIIDGQDTMYTMSGIITPQLYQALLANLRVVSDR